MSSSAVYAKRILPSVYALLPPRSSTGARSSTSTRAPPSAAASAAHIAALPPPTTTTSNSRSVTANPLLRRNVGVPDHLGPLRHFALQIAAKLGRTAGHGLDALVPQALAQLRAGDGLCRFGAEALHDGRGGRGRHHE